jgi:hypothetical protein
MFSVFQFLSLISINFRIDINGGHSKLYIQNAVKAHEGWYQCTATSPAGTVITRTTVTVIRNLFFKF